MDTGQYARMAARSVTEGVIGNLQGDRLYAPTPRCRLLMPPEHAPRIVCHASLVSAAERAARLGQQPLTLWLTGLSGAGKSTLARALERELHDRGHSCSVLDGDELRRGLNRDLGFTPAERSENIRRIAEVARLMNDAGLIVITAFISPYRTDRAAASGIIGGTRFREVHASTPLAVCEARDPKGFYRQARRGALAAFTGVSAPYEAPQAPALMLDTAQLSLPEAVARLLRLVGRTSDGASGESGSRQQPKPA